MESINFPAIINSVFYAFLGVGILLVCYIILEKLTPEKSWKEIVEQKNVALAIVFGAFIIGISIIIASAING